MKNVLILVLLTQTMLVAGCSKDNAPGAGGAGGTVKGRVTDAKGNGMANVKVVIENTVLYATYVYATTDANGYYKATVPPGSWHALVTIQRTFLDKPYNFDLCPDVDDFFAGSEGAVRNFTWKLSGARPSGGFYGSNVAVYSEPGSSFGMDEVELTLTPDGPLVDGSMGTPITKKLTDIGGGEDGIRDVPVGMYSITARNTITGVPLQIRLRNTGAYASSVIGTFNSGFTGTSNYQIVVQVK
ncbi:MAG TPA: carboxypeptidase-like regulatory domain-containing protein [Chitinophagaceae bacterium]|nr:carboxypeptidase-like regulatory domain-containing protein [Chitinophagaceae bacterium]